jgi:hypothetical protein
MKIDECKRRHINNIGFVDPDKVHHDTVRDNPFDTGSNLLRFSTEQHLCDSILFPYNYR